MTIAKADDFTLGRLAVVQFDPHDGSNRRRKIGNAHGHADRFRDRAGERRDERRVQIVEHRFHANTTSKNISRKGAKAQSREPKPLTVMKAENSEFVFNQLQLTFINGYFPCLYLAPLRLCVRPFLLLKLLLNPFELRFDLVIDFAKFGRHSAAAGGDRWIGHDCSWRELAKRF